MTLLITCSEISVKRYILRTDFIRQICSSGAIKVVLAVPEGETEEYRREFGGPDVVVEGVPEVKQSLGVKILAFFARNAHPSRTVVWVEKEQYFLDGNLLMYLVRRFMRAVFAFLPLTHLFIRFAELRIKDDPAVVSVLNKYRPDAVLTTVLFRDFDVGFARTAKKRNIALFGMIRSWDNLTTYGYIRVVPDVFLAQSEFIADMARRYQKFPASMIKVTGTPLYDLYIKKDILWPREKFFASYDTGPVAGIILYGAMGKFLFPKEDEVIALFEDILARYGNRLTDVKFIYRAHPSFPVDEEIRRKSAGVLISQPGTLLKPGSSERYGMMREDEEFYVNSLYHASLIITPASTVAIEAMLFDKPVILLAFDPSLPPADARSAKEFLKYFTHFREMLNCKGVDIAHSPEELGELLIKNLGNPGLNSKNRDCVRKRFLDPLDGKSSLRMVKYVMDALK